MQLLVWLMHVQLHILNAFIFQSSQGTGCNFSVLKSDIWTLVSKGAGFHAQGACRQTAPQHAEGHGDSFQHASNGTAARQVHPTASG